MSVTPRWWMGFLVLVLASCQGKPVGGPPPTPTVVASAPPQRQIIDWDEFVGRFEAVNTVQI